MVERVIGYREVDILDKKGNFVRKGYVSVTKDLGPRKLTTFDHNPYIKSDVREQKQPITRERE